MKNRLDSLLMHTKYEDAPTTNNGIELAHRHTMDGREPNAARFHLTYPIQK